MFASGYQAGLFWLAKQKIKEISTVGNHKTISNSAYIYREKYSILGKLLD